MSNSARQTAHTQIHQSIVPFFFYVNRKNVCLKLPINSGACSIRHRHTHAHGHHVKFCLEIKILFLNLKHIYPYNRLYIINAREPARARKHQTI